MVNYRELTPEEGIQYRYDCPTCGGKNTFSIRREGGCISYNCFRASCDHKKSRGSTSYIRSLAELRHYRPKHVSFTSNSFRLPDSITLSALPEEAIRELKRRYSWEAYLRGYVKCGFDTVESRVVFLIQHRGCITGAVGRFINPYNEVLHNKHFNGSTPTDRKLFRNPVSWGTTSTRLIPKTKTYLNSTGVLEIGEGSTAVVVEDVFSACSVSRDTRYTGIPLCGTILKPDHLEVLSRYKRVIIALDKDASRKSLKYHELLKFMFKDVKVVFLEQDLKDCAVINLEEEVTMKS